MGELKSLLRTAKVTFLALAHVGVALTVVCGVWLAISTGAQAWMLRQGKIAQQEERERNAQAAPVNYARFAPKEPAGYADLLEGADGPPKPARDLSYLLEDETASPPAAAPNYARFYKPDERAKPARKQVNRGSAAPAQRP